MAEAACWQHCCGVVGRGEIASVCNSGGFLITDAFIIGAGAVLFAEFSVIFFN
jgi:hypothetical protein